MQNKIIRFFTSIFILILAGCAKEVSNSEELLAYTLDVSNGVSQKTEIGNVSVSVSVRPSDLMMARELQNNPDGIDKVTRKYQDQVYFLLSYSKEGRDILRSGVSGQGDYSQKLHELSFNMKQYVHLIAGNDTIPVYDYIYQNMFGASHSTDVLFAFRKQDISKSAPAIEFVLKDIGFGIGKQVFTFQQEDIERIPQLVLHSPHTN